MTKAERRRLVGQVARGQLSGIADRLKLVLGRRADRIDDVPDPPDSVMARAAEEACADQPAAIVGHSYRTWAYGRALAVVDGDTSLDDELFYVAALLHDAGIVESVTGEDFTLRSGRIAAACGEGHLDESDVRHVRDAISAHATPGASAAVDGAVRMAPSRS